MNEQQTSIAQDIEQLFKKTTEANKTFVSESAKFLGRLSASKINREEQVSMGKQLVLDAINMFVKLNIQHTSNLIDLGVSITKRLNQHSDSKPDDSSANQVFPGDNKPAFVLNFSSAPGATATTQFLLDSDKKEPVLCNLKQTDYILQGDPSVRFSFETTFSPQSFQLVFGEPRKVEINIKIPADAKEGVYRSNIQVNGFEHVYFSLFITVITPEDLTYKFSE